MAAEYHTYNYHYKIKKMRNDSRSRVKQSLANALVSNRTRDDWSELKKINKSKIEPIYTVNMYIELLQTSFHVSKNHYTLV